MSGGFRPTTCRSRGTWGGRGYHAHAGGVHHSREYKIMRSSMVKLMGGSRFAIGYVRKSRWGEAMMGWDGPAQFVIRFIFFDSSP